MDIFFILLLAGFICGMVYLLKIKWIRRWLPAWMPAVIIAGVVLVIRFLPYLEFFSDGIVFFLLLAGVIGGILYLLKIEWIRRLWPMLLAACVLFIIFGYPLLAVTSLWWYDEGPGVLDRYLPLGGKFKIVELDGFETFSGKKDDRYYFTVLMKSPPKNTDTLKARMVQYFHEKRKYINTADSGSYLSNVIFYKYTRRTAYFINNDEDPGGFFTAYLDKYPDTRIGYISAREPCDNDPAKYEDVIYMYEEGGRYEGGRYRETAEGLYSECAATPAFSPEDVRSNPDSIAMVFVGGGMFTNGLKDFYISRYEVTQGLWKSVMGRNPSDSLSASYVDDVPVKYGVGDNYPVYYVSWNDVQDFIAALNAKTGKKYRLPAKKEWYYAEQGGNRSNGYEYSGSNTIGAVAWYSENNRERPGTKGAFTYGAKQVGIKQANELGIHDMCGNVMEFVSDTHYYTDSEGHTALGCGWYHATSVCRVSYDFLHSKWDEGGVMVGFRLAHDP